MERIPTRKRPHKAHPKFKEPEPVQTTTTPFFERPGRKVSREEQTTLMHRQVLSDFKFAGSRASLRKVKHELPEGLKKPDGRAE